MDHGYYKADSPFAKRVAVLANKLTKRWKRCRQCSAAAAVYADPTRGHSDCIYCGKPYKRPATTQTAASAAAEASK